MTESTRVADELSKIMVNSLLQLKKLVDNESDGGIDLLSTINLFLLGVISTAVDLAQIELPGSAPLIYAEVEAAAKSGGLRSIKKMQNITGSTHYSVSNIDPDDAMAAMDYVGQALSTALFKGLHELPLPLRKPDVMLRAIEALLANVLNQKFENAHDVLDNMCGHVHMALTDLKKQKH